MNRHERRAQNVVLRNFRRAYAPLNKPDPEIAEARAARSSKLRRLGVLGLLLLVLSLALGACACGPRAWSPQDREDAFFSCREEGVPVSACQCFVVALEHYAKDPLAVGPEAIEASIRVCSDAPAPRPRLFAVGLR
jgi:hypothetical protein